MTKPANIERFAPFSVYVSHKGTNNGYDFIHKFGDAPDFDTSDGEVTIWDGADDGNIDQMTYVYSTTAAIDSISSSNAGDDHQIQLQGLDEDYNLVTQNATLDGQTRVALTTPLIRIFRMKNNGFTDLAGYVYVYENTAITAGVPNDTTKVRAIIQPGYNQTLMALYTVPAGKYAYMRDFYASTAGASKDSSYIIRFYAREYDTVTSQHKAFQLKNVNSITDGGNTYLKQDYTEPERFKPMTDLEMRVEMTAGGASSAAISGGFNLLLIDVL